MRCDVAHAVSYIEGREARYDFGRYIRVVGIPNMVRYLCEGCAKGRIAPQHRAQFALNEGR